MKVSSRCTLWVLGLVFVLLALNLSAFADMSWSPVACSPSLINVKAGNNVAFQAMNGDGKYSWLANGSSSINGGDRVFTTTYKIPGIYTVEVVSGNTKSVCTVMVSPAADSQQAGFYAGWPWWAKLLFWIVILLLLAVAVAGIVNAILARRRSKIEEEERDVRIRERREDTEYRNRVDTERRTRDSAEDAHRKHEEEVLSTVPDYIHRHDEHMDEQKKRWVMDDQRLADQERFRKEARSVRVDGELEPDSAGVYRIVNPNRQIIRLSFDEPHPIDLKIGEPQLRIVHDVPSSGQAVREEQRVKVAEPGPAVVENTTTERVATEPVVVSDPAPAEEVPANAATTMLGTDYRPSEDENPTTRIKRTATDTKEPAAD